MSRAVSLFTLIIFTATQVFSNFAQQAYHSFYLSPRSIALAGHVGLEMVFSSAHFAKGSIEITRHETLDAILDEAQAQFGYEEVDYSVIQSLTQHISGNHAELKAQITQLIQTKKVTFKVTQNFNDHFNDPDGKSFYFISRVKNGVLEINLTNLFYQKISPRILAEILALSYLKMRGEKCYSDSIHNGVLVSGDSLREKLRGISPFTAFVLNEAYRKGNVGYLDAIKEEDLPSSDGFLREEAQNLKQKLVESYNEPEIRGTTLSERVIINKAIDDVIRNFREVSLSPEALQVLVRKNLLVVSVNVPKDIRGLGIKNILISTKSNNLYETVSVALNRWLVCLFPPHKKQDGIGKKPSEDLPFEHNPNFSPFENDNFENDNWQPFSGQGGIAVAFPGLKTKSSKMDGKWFSETPAEIMASFMKMYAKENVTGVQANILANEELRRRQVINQTFSVHLRQDQERAIREFVQTRFLSPWAVSNTKFQLPPEFLEKLFQQILLADASPFTNGDLFELEFYREIEKGEEASFVIRIVIDPFSRQVAFYRTSKNDSVLSVIQFPDEIFDLSDNFDIGTSNLRSLEIKTPQGSQNLLSFLVRSGVIPAHWNFNNNPILSLHYELIYRLELTPDGFQLKTVSSGVKRLIFCECEKGFHVAGNFIGRHEVVKLAEALIPYSEQAIKKEQEVRNIMLSGHTHPSIGDGLIHDMSAGDVGCNLLLNETLSKLNLPRIVPEMIVHEIEGCRYQVRFYIPKPETLQMWHQMPDERRHRMCEEIANNLSTYYQIFSFNLDLKSAIPSAIPKPGLKERATVNSAILESL